MQDQIVIGSVAKPQGIKGELKVIPLTDTPERFKDLKTVIIDGKNYTVTKAILGGGFVILSFLEIKDRNLAETFRNKKICVKREDAVTLTEGRYFIVDIIGCYLFDENEKIGEIIDITEGHTDIFVVKCLNGKIMRFPFLKKVVKNVDVSANRVEVYGDKLKEVECYED